MEAFYAYRDSNKGRKDVKVFSTLPTCLIFPPSISLSLSLSEPNTDIFSTFKIDAEEVSRSMRLLTLCTLGAKDKTLPYDKIASALQVDLSEVEFWVVDAISNQLLEASMDQFKSVVQVLSIACSRES